jgi:PAS domain S-box-containing protein
MIQEADQNSGKPPEEYFRKMYKRHFQGALVLAGATLIMWLFAMAAYLLDIISYPHFIGVSLAVLYLIAINPPTLWVFKRIQHQGRLVSFSILINLLEIIGYTAVIYFLGGIEATYLTILYAVVIAYVGSVSKRRHTFLITGICIAAYNAMILLEGASLIPWYKVFPDFHIPWSHRLARMFVIDGLLLVVAYITSYTAILLRKAKNDLLTAHGVLERQVAERTNELSRANEELRSYITERKMAEDALRESEKKYRIITENTADIISIMDMNLRFTYISPAITHLRGFTVEEAMAQTLDQVLTPESMKVALEVFENEMRLEASGTADPDRGRTLELEEYKKDGSTVWMEVNFSYLRDKDSQAVDILTVSRDITVRKLFESKLQQAQKFEAIGSLAGGIAHDFNNLLMGIQGRTSLISLGVVDSHPNLEHIQAIEEYIQSASNLTKQLLGLARGGKYEVIPIDINELVLGSSAMFGRTKKEIQIHTKYYESPLVVEADRGQIEQVLLNLYINAWQAMPPTGGDIYLETNIVELDETYCKSHQIKTGLYIKVSVTDTGSGMDETTRLQVFDPFFTTKDKGRGTGLGLASAYGIIKNHGGTITVYSETSHGTTFNIYLPQSGKQSQPVSPVEKEIRKGTETILLVDDEELIIVVGQAMLENLGYRVITGRNGQEAVHLITELGKQINLVILDMIMPGMDGGATFDRIRQIHPDMPVLLSSGYAINGHADKIMHRGCNGFIQKPYNFSELSQKIRKVLDDANTSAQ